MTSSPVALRPVTVHNWQACVALQLYPDQFGLLPDNLYSLAEAQFYPDGESLAVYTLSGEIVGFARYGRDATPGDLKIYRLMIDRAHQGKGYGRAAMRRLIERLEQLEGSERIRISYQDHNSVARNLYRSLGFVELYTDTTGKVTAGLELAKQGVG